MNKYDQLDSIEGRLDVIESKQDELNQILANNSELQQNFTGELKRTSDHILEHISRSYECGGTGGWKRVVYLNMSDPTTNCPSGWNLTSYSKRTCGKANTTSLTCHSVFFPVSGGNYTSVCGSIIAYQHGHIDAFEAYDDGQAFTIDEAYVAGVSLTHGSPRQHIWTFAAGTSEDDNDDEACPCDASISIRIPPFVGEDYFCESGVSSGSTSGFHPDDPLWDGKGCTGSSRCCSFNNPPYFVKQLPSSTSDDIEARLCLLNGNEDSPIEFIELYVKTSLDDSIEAKLNILEQNQNELSEKIEKVSEEIGINVVANITKQLDNKAEELEELTKQMGKANNILHTHVGQMDSYECGGTGGWRRVVYLNMSDPTTNCPSGWSLTSYSKRTCGKANNNGLTCHSAFFPVIGGNYTSVCGSIIAYQHGHIDAFEAYDNRRAITIDQAYVAGVSLTHGNPRQHIWTFAAGASETITHDEGCPCNGARVNLPPFIEGDYFCESGVSSGSAAGFHPDDPLWDGEGCTGSSTCCSFNNPPYFVKKLPTSTSDSIEARICLMDGVEDSPVESVELYVKYDQHDSITARLDRIESKQSELNHRVATSSDLLKVQQNITMEIQNASDYVVEYSHTYECGGTRGWQRVVYLDMSDPNNNCPSGWSLTSYSKRTCGKANTTHLTCHSAFFPVSRGSYTSVCGSIIAYQYGHLDAFEVYNDRRATNINEAYVNGVSLTHGSPRQHIWTFAAGSTEDDNDDEACPCDTTFNIQIPFFVGEDYFCESGVSSGSTSGFHPDDPLWDGEGCTGSSSCCSFNNPPYFVKQLPITTSDALEARICLYDGDEDSPVQFIELYVK